MIAQFGGKGSQCSKKTLPLKIRYGGRTPPPALIVSTTVTHSRFTACKTFCLPWYSAEHMIYCEEEHLSRIPSHQSSRYQPEVYHIFGWYFGRDQITFYESRVIRKSSLVVISTRETGGKRIMAFDKACDPIFASFRRVSKGLDSRARSCKLAISRHIACVRANPPWSIESSHSLIELFSSPENVWRWWRRATRLS